MARANFLTPVPPPTERSETHLGVLQIHLTQLLWLPCLQAALENFFADVHTTGHTNFTAGVSVALELFEGTDSEMVGVLQ